jgi:HPt (histidine-containing phosphotransfer) domain-containing protein
MKLALHAKDFETVQKVGHNFKGSGSAYGFDAVTEFGRTIEQAAKKSDPGSIEEKIGDLEIYLNNLEIVFRV